MNKGNKLQSVSFTGHRPSSLPWGYNSNDKECINLKEKLKTIIKKLFKIDITTFYNGLAEGFDMYAMEVLLELKKEGFPLYIVGCIPCGNQSAFYSSDNKLLYEEMKNSCDELYYVTEGKYFNGCTHIRNKYMIDNSSILIAYSRKETGGAASTIRYAKKQNLDIIQM